MIPCNRRVSREEFSRLKTQPFQKIIGDWFSVRLYAGKNLQNAKISIIVSSKIAQGVARNKIRRKLYDALKLLCVQNIILVVYVRALPKTADSLKAGIGRISKEIY